jgi:ferredoxin
MPVRVTVNSQGIEVPAGHTLFECAETMGVRVPTSCFKQGKCRECLVELVEGMELLSARSPEEEHLITERLVAGIDMDWAARIVRRYRKVVNLPVMAQPNAGTPELVDMQVVYRQTPEKMGTGLEALLDAGAGIGGGCCGSASPHIAFLRAKMDRISRQEAG